MGLGRKKVDVSKKDSSGDDRRTSRGAFSHADGSQRHNGGTDGSGVRWTALIGISLVLTGLALGIFWFFTGFEVIGIVEINMRRGGYAGPIYGDVILSVVLIGVGLRLWLWGRRQR
jgi:hypothetical protein